jgi:PAS domain-containing protein
MQGAFMSIPADTKRTPEQLRIEAEAHLSLGSTPAFYGTTLGTDAISLLLRLAGNANTASDALKLLHELQTHQVELDLQHEELLSTASESLSEISLYKGFFDMNSLSSFILDSNGRILQCNEAGANMVSMARSDLTGQRLGAFFLAGSRITFAKQIELLGPACNGIECDIQLRDDPTEEHKPLTAWLSSNGTAILVTIASAPPVPQSGAH